MEDIKLYEEITLPQCEKLISKIINLPYQSCKFRDVSTNQLMCPIARTNFEDNDDILKIIHCNHIF